jgi:hypothetical protein
MEGLSVADWQGWIMPGVVAMVYAAWGLSALRRRRG